MKFDEIVKAMTAKEIVMAMVQGLRNEHVKIKMESFGDYNITTKKCFGCAATNIICEISSKVFTSDNILTTEQRAQFIESDIHFLCFFEAAINNLRRGEFSEYNQFAEIIGIALIGCEDYSAPCLLNNYSEDELVEWENLANTL